MKMKKLIRFFLKSGIALLKGLKKLAAIFLIFLLLGSTTLLFVDIKKFSALVMCVWIFSAAYYVFVLKKDKQE